MANADLQKHFHSFVRFYSGSLYNAESSIPLQIARDQNQVSIPATDGDLEGGTFLFDGFTNMDATPKMVYKEHVKELIDSVLKGYNGTFVSVGTESADHFTFALDSKSSVLYEVAKHILNCIQKLKKKGMSSNLTVPCSYVMIANENVYDLLKGFKNEDCGDIAGGDESSSELSIADSRVHGCKTIEAKTVKDVRNMLNHGSKSRNMMLLNLPKCKVYSCTFSIGIEFSKFGSMFAPISGTFMLTALVIPDYLDVNALKSGNISMDMKCVVALTSVIERLSALSNSGSLCCYEDSLLTKLLQATFGGNSKTILMSHAASSIPLHCLAQSCFLLQLGSKARLIENKPDKTELAEKALMDAYRKEMKRQSVWNKSNQKTNPPEAASAAEDELMIAQALASDQFEYYDSEDSDDDELVVTGGKPRSQKHSKIILKGKKLSQISTKDHNLTGDEDVTVESIIALIQDPDTGVPRAAESSLVNVKIHRGKGSVFSGAAIVKWLLANITGVSSIEEAEQLGQILLDKGAIFHSDGASLFFNSENLFYYARDPLRPGKVLSIDEIRALLAPQEKKLPTLQLPEIKEVSSSKSELEEEPMPSVEPTVTVPSVEPMVTVPSVELTVNVPSVEPTVTVEDSSPVVTPTNPDEQPQVSSSDLVSNESPDGVPEDIPSESTDVIHEPSPPDPPHITTALSDKEDTVKSQEIISDDNYPEQQTKEQTNIKVEELVNEPNLQDIQDVDLVTLERTTDYPHPLHFASAIGKEPGVIEQLVKWYGVDCLDEQNRTPLMFAALGNKATVCRYLIECGAVVDKKDRSGLSAAHIACYHGSKDALHVLLKHKANIASLDRMFHTCYHWSAVPDSSSCLKLLLRYSPHSVTIDTMVDKHELSPLHWAMYYNHPVHLKLMITKCQNLLGHDSKGRTLMTYAVKQRLPDCVMVLGTSSIDLVSAPDKGGLTPLHHASVDKAPFYSAYLLSILKDANSSGIDACDSAGRTPLHYATTYQREQNVQLLLQFGASKSVKDSDGQTPLELARSYGTVKEEITNLFNGVLPAEGIDLASILSPATSAPKTNENLESKLCFIL